MYIDNVSRLFKIIEWFGEPDFEEYISPITLDSYFIETKEINDTDIIIDEGDIF